MKSPNPQAQNPGFAHPAQPVVSTPQLGVGAGGGGSPDQPIHRTVRVSHDRGASPAVSQRPATTAKK